MFYNGFLSGQSLPPTHTFTLTCLKTGSGIIQCHKLRILTLGCFSHDQCNEVYIYNVKFIMKCNKLIKIATLNLTSYWLLQNEYRHNTHNIGITSKDILYWTTHIDDNKFISVEFFSDFASLSEIWVSYSIKVFTASRIQDADKTAYPATGVDEKYLTSQPFVSRINKSSSSVIGNWKSSKDFC